MHHVRDGASAVLPINTPQCVNGSIFIFLAEALGVPPLSLSYPLTPALRRGLVGGGVLCLSATLLRVGDVAVSGIPLLRVTLVGHDGGRALVLLPHSPCQDGDRQDRCD